MIYRYQHAGLPLYAIPDITVVYASRASRCVRRELYTLSLSLTHTFLSYPRHLLRSWTCLREWAGGEGGGGAAESGGRGEGGGAEEGER